MKLGTIEIKNHTIIVHDPDDGGMLPVIGAIAPVKLHINGVVLDTESSVSAADRIEWKLKEKPLFAIQVSEDKLRAYFHLYARHRYAWQLVNTERMSRIIVSAEEDKSIVLDTVHLSDVASELEQKSITANVELALIQVELMQQTGQPIAIANGKAAVPGMDAKLEIYFSEGVESRFCENSGAVDFRNHLHIPAVNKGEIIARKISKVDGIPGYDVHGEIILPIPSKDIPVVVKPGVELTAEGEIIAMKEGRPRVTGKSVKAFDISTSFMVSGDVDIGTGNIVFPGDVIVSGNVTDNMIVESLGNVYIYGSVFNATITSTGSIHVNGNVIGSKLYSGYYGVLFNRLYTSSKALGDHLEKLLSDAEMLEQALETRRQSSRFGKIVQLLMERKLKEISAAVGELLTVIASIQKIKKNEYTKLREMSINFIQPEKDFETITHRFLQSYLALLRETSEEVARMQEVKVNTVINQCHNSELKTNGDIVIKREGVILSDLYAAENIVFQYESAVCRGARLEADGIISAKIVGGQTGSKTILKAKKGVSVKKMYEGRVCIGRNCVDIFEWVENKFFGA